MASPAKPIFEVGVIYKYRTRHYLAVDQQLLVTVVKGVLREIRPVIRYAVVRGLRVEDLCGIWGVTLNEIDKISAEYLTPSKDGVKRRTSRFSTPRSQGKEVEEETWRRVRTHRISVES